LRLCEHAIAPAFRVGSELVGQLIFTPCPGTKETSVSQALATLRDAGASALVTLMPSEELLQNEIDLLPEDANCWARMVPPAGGRRRSTRRAVCCRLGNHRERLKELVMTGKTIAIHCKGGSAAPACLPPA
jgi:hypothetical protein